MKATAYVNLDWGDRYGQPPKLPEEIERDRLRVKEILERTGYQHEFAPNRHLYKFEVVVHSKVFDVLIEELQSDSHLVVSPITVFRSYTQRELENVDLLFWSPTNQTIEEDHYDLYPNHDEEEIGSYSKRCPSCGARLKQIRELLVNKTLMGKRDVSLTYSNQVVLTERVGRLLQEHELTGFELWPMHHYKKSYRGEPTLYQLRVTHILPPMASPPTEFESVKDCPVCQRKSQFLKRTHWWGQIQYRDYTDGYYSRNVLGDVRDFSFTSEWFGEQRTASQAIIITQRLYRLLREWKVKNWAAVPVYIVN
jgi:hypothetical protein